MRFDRRMILGLAASALVAPARARGASRVAIVDWALLETALAMGIVPVAASELRQYEKVVQEPSLPDGVADIGLRGTPNFEMLRLARPDLILISQFYEYQRAMLERIAPVASLPSYEAGRAPFDLLARTTRRLGAMLDETERARRLVRDVENELISARAALVANAGRPIFVISLGDARHFRAFGADSMLGEMVDRLGLRNAWSDPTSYSAAAPVGIEALARVPEAGIVVVEPVPPEAGRRLARNALWQALPAVREGRVAVLPPVSHFGGLPSARRFARLLVDAVDEWPLA